MSWCLYTPIYICIVLFFPISSCSSKMHQCTVGQMAIANPSISLEQSIAMRIKCIGLGCVVDMVIIWYIRKLFYINTIVFVNFFTLKMKRTKKSNYELAPLLMCNFSLWVFFYIGLAIQSVYNCTIVIDTLTIILTTGIHHPGGILLWTIFIFINYLYD